MPAFQLDVKEPFFLGNSVRGYSCTNKSILTKKKHLHKNVFIWLLFCVVKIYILYYYFNFNDQNLIFMHYVK